MRKLTQEEFIKKAKDIHGDKYDYSISMYVNHRTPIKIICPIHDVFEQLANAHLDGSGCRKCKYVEHGKKLKIGIEEFIRRAKEVHGDKYDYSLVEYKAGNTKVKIICPEHGIFEQTPNHHVIRGDQCSFCAIKERTERVIKAGKECLLTQEEFIRRAKEVHGDKYDYSLTDYQGMFKKVKIICSKHGVFEQTPSCHLSHGCHKCKSSHGEVIIRKYLQSNNIVFEEQKTFNDCKNINKLRFDFYLPDDNLLIEYNGRQHYEPFAFGEKRFERFKKQVINDNIKKKFCEGEHTPNLLIIKYDELNVDEIISAKLNKGENDDFKRIH